MFPIYGKKCAQHFRNRILQILPFQKVKSYRVVNVWCGGCPFLPMVWWMYGVVDVCVVDVVQSNSASRRARGSLKKENSSEFNPEEYKQVKSSPPEGLVAQGL